VKLIHESKYSIAKASKVTNIPYDNAKAINRTYLKELRVKKISYKQRYQTRKANCQKNKRRLSRKNIASDYDSSNESSQSLDSLSETKIETVGGKIAGDFAQSTISKPEVEKV